MKLKNLGLLAILIVVTAFISACGSYEYKGSQLEPPLSVPDFELTDTNEQPFRMSEMEGDVALVFFGYTYCPDVCPLTLSDVKTALADFEERDRVTVIFISVDPERDTPEAIAKYIGSFDPEFVGLTDPDFATIQQVMTPFGAYAEKEEIENSAAGYLVNHTARLYLLVPDQGVLLTYPFGFEPEDLRSDLEAVLDQLPDDRT